MKKVAILTINDYQNYGNRLQNYAAQEVLKSLGFSVETIRNTTNTSGNGVIGKLIGKIHRLNKMTISEIYRKLNLKIWEYAHKGIVKECNIKKTLAFKKFTLDNILETDYCISEHNIPNDLLERFDYFITGSDQVWNPTFRYGCSVDFLTFAPKNKRIAYAPSFGISQIPSNYKENYKLWLSEMASLSVREDAGAKIIKELTGRDAVVLVDPTLMLTKEKWMSISKKASNKPKNKYLLTYFLGKISKENQGKMKEIADKNKLQILNLADISDRETYKADPSEFIDYINSASVFFTDSFHGTVFSILLEKPFVVFNREGKIPSMNSRIETLLSKFKLESRRWENIKNNDDIFNINFSHIPPILEFERNKTIKYLRGALDIKDER
ncbi:polysaccharide pyruvyl transferase family protein [uncultured Clostridium sp.]|uniref:polysaccharide pyruvyl transferase family protein n=1 Tax=uncultured Clostridium sp. TaxID=59620 RepID=UPI0028F061CE|nr:polysaccharide pyruvyl transferase family protein [uncultured Clostridium sp.]